MDSAFKRQMAPPLALLVLAALTPNSHRVTITDENVEPLKLDDSPDLVGISVKADTARRTWEIARSYRRRNIPVVLGGIYPTTCPDQCAIHADACVIGEAEPLWSLLLHDVQSGRLKKIYAHKSPPDLSYTPVPKWDLIDHKRYLYTNTLTIGRGCRYNCDFCYNSSPNLPSGHRIKPFNNILREIESLKSRHVMFIDDNFIANPSFARQLVKKLQPLRLTWHTAVSANIARYDGMIELMAESGCRSLFIGFESLNPQNLQAANKKQNHIDEYEHTISKIHSCGMMVNASIIFGFDNDGIEVFDRTVEWLIEQKIETMTAHILTPYPGTVLHKKLTSQNRIFDHDLTHYNTSHAVFYPANMTAKELENGYLNAYRRFYSWSSIWARIPRDSRRLMPYLMFNAFYRKFGRACSILRLIGFMHLLGKMGALFSYPNLAVRRNSICKVDRSFLSKLH